MKIVVIGSSNTDMIIRVPRIPKPGETILGGRFLSAAGGKGANQAVAAARAGGKVTFIASIGPDTIGELALDGFRKDGIDISQVFRDESEPSGVALIFVGDDGENSIGVAGGANMALSPEKVSNRRHVIEQAGILLMQLETPLPTIETAAEIAAERNIPVILNPAPAQSLPESLLARIFLLTPNESEAELLTGLPVNGADGAPEAAKVLRKRGVANVIITLGAAGSFLSMPGKEILIPGFQVNPVDTTAAGDIFNGALCVAVSEGKDLPDAVRFASAAAAISVTRPGAQPSAPRRHEILELLEHAGSG